MQITETRYKKMESQLKELRRKFDEAKEANKIAASAGDLSENTEYETSRLEVERLNGQVRDLEDKIRNAEIVAVDRSPRIVIGSVIDVVRVDSSGNPVGQERRFRYDVSGDTILQRVLGVQSSLGKVINNGTSGIYTVPDNGGIQYRVTKCLDKDAEDFE